MFKRFLASRIQAAKGLIMGQRGEAGVMTYIKTFILGAVAILIVINFLGPVGAAVADLVAEDAGTTTKTILQMALTLLMGAGILFFGISVFFKVGGKKG